MNLFLDSETCGLHSIAVLLQYAIDEGPVVLYEPWKEPVWRTRGLLRDFTKYNLIGFNLGFDVFHVAKLATIWELLPDDLIPEQDIPLVAKMERIAPWGNCWKPQASCDLMLHSRKGRYQTLMPRKPIRIRKVPKVIAEEVVKSLGEAIYFDKIFFAKTKTNPGEWSIIPREDSEHLVDLKLSFNPAGGLKFLAEFALGYKPKFHFSDVELSKEYRPSELGYAPFAHCAPEPDKAWPHMVKHHIDHWHNCKEAREYAHDDITITRDLWKHFECPEAGDDDSELATMVATSRWRGLRILPGDIQSLLDESKAVVATSPLNINAHRQVRAYLEETMDEIQKLALVDGCSKQVLKSIVSSEEWNINPELQKRAAKLLEVKEAIKEVELFEKLLHAGRLHADLNIIGAKSGRMSGTGGLNVQGIKNIKTIRKCFPLKDTEVFEPAVRENLVALVGEEKVRQLEANLLSDLSLGDFSSFEVCIADAVFNDPQLREDLLTGRSIHAEFGAMLYDMTYEEVLATKGTKNDLYTDAKSAFFASALYMGDEGTINRKQGVPIEKAREALNSLGKRYKKLGEARNQIVEEYSAMSQPGGLGTAIEWKDPKTTAHTMFGFPRDFSMEWQICRKLYDLAQAPPPEWRKISAKVIRSRRIQTAGGAAQSALYGAAFGLQGVNLRASANHKIQGTGAQITKRVQRKVGDLQPAGFHPWRVATLQVHDELLVVHKPELAEEVAKVIADEVQELKSVVPLLAIDWLSHGNSWADK